MRRYLRNDRGSAILPFTTCFVLAMTTLLVMLSVYISAEINFINIRNTMKNELTNVSLRITSDTCKTMREGNIGEYYSKLTTDASYSNELERLVIDKIESAMPLETDNYKVEDIDLAFTNNSDNIEYVFTCDVIYYIDLLGSRASVRNDAIVLTGRHNLKLY